MYAQTALRLLNTSSIANLSSVVAALGGECNTFRGVCSPGGEVLLGPDFCNGSYMGFSMWHHHAGENGASGAITQMPILGNIKNPFGDVQDTAVGPDRYGHGYYKAVTGSNITVELRASNHSGIYQYTFPAEHTANVIVDISHVFQPSQGQELTYKAGAFEVLSDRSYKGTGHYIGRNESAHNVSFCGYFDNAVDATLYKLDGKRIHKIKPEKDGKIRHALTKHRIAAVFTFPNTTIVSRVGLSMDSAEEACENVNAELPKGMHIDANNVSDTIPPEITMAPSSNGTGTKPDNTTGTSIGADVEGPQLSGNHFKIFIILLGVILGLLFLCIIILFTLCVGAHKHFKKEKTQNKLGRHFRSGDIPPRL